MNPGAAQGDNIRSKKRRVPWKAAVVLDAGVSCQSVNQFPAAVSGWKVKEAKMKRSLQTLIVGLFVIALTHANPCVAQTQWVDINGNVTYNGTPVCAMILANGQHMFTSETDGCFHLNVPLDGNGQITVFAFCSGLAPFQQVIFPEEGHNMQIELEASAGGQGMDVDYSLHALVGNWVRINGTVEYKGAPVCAMILANGQYMFSCDEHYGTFDLNVPLDDNDEIELYAFCSGVEPFMQMISYVPETNIYTGRYNGRFYGDDYGDFTFFVDSEGHISGTAYSEKYGDTFYLSGSVNASGGIDVAVGSVSSGVTFVGQIDSSGGVQGTWSSAYYGVCGTFTGKKTS